MNARTYLFRALMLDYVPADGESGENIAVEVSRMAVNVERFAGRPAHSMRDAHLLIGQARMSSIRQRRALLQALIAHDETVMW